MTNSTELTIAVNGTPPIISGSVCEGFICEGFFYKDEPEASASVTYVKFDGVWYRLYFEYQLIFWRTFKSEPLPLEITEESFRYPHTNVGEMARVVGQKLLIYEMLPTPEGSKVIFNFSDGSRIVIEDKNDSASYIIEPAIG